MMVWYILSAVWNEVENLFGTIEESYELIIRKIEFILEEDLENAPDAVLPAR